MIAIARCFAAAALALALSAAHAQSDPEYSATFAGSLTSISPRVTNVNSSGQTVSVFGIEGDYPFGFILQTMITDPDGQTRLVGPQANGMFQYDGRFGPFINDVGQVAGTTARHPSIPVGVRAFFVDMDGTTTTIRDPADPGEDTFVTGMNAAGIVWGHAARHGDRWLQGYFTGPNGVGMTFFGDASHCSLFSIFCGSFSRVTDVNIFGQAIGTIRLQVDDPTSTSFITGMNGVGLFELSSLADLPDDALLTTALDIDDLGRILAQANDGRTYLLTPVPEPSTYALMLVGLAALAIRRVSRPRRAT